MIKYILAALVVGVSVGYVNNGWGMSVLNEWVSVGLFNAALYVLLFVMGLSFAVDGEAVERFRRAGIRVLAVPFLVGLGSVLGGFVGGLLLRVDVVRCMAVSAGFGWYTLAGPLVSQLFGVEWGAWGFAVNFLRELITIVGVSLLVKVDRYAPVAAGGATTMDTTLPVIVKYVGKDTLISAFSSGFVLSLAAPFAIMAVATLM
jgi:uncharacterized membrane protein YbjE (DUF340 family)